MEIPGGREGEVEGTKALRHAQCVCRMPSVSAALQGGQFAWQGEGDVQEVRESVASDHAEWLGYYKDFRFYCK